MYTKESSQQSLEIPVHQQSHRLSDRNKLITKNDTGIYTKESSQQSLEIPNNNLDVKFEKANIETAGQKKE